MNFSRKNNDNKKKQHMYKHGASTKKNKQTKTRFLCVDRIIILFASNLQEFLRI